MALSYANYHQSWILPLPQQPLKIQDNWSRLLGGDRTPTPQTDMKINYSKIVIVIGVHCIFKKGKRKKFLLLGRIHFSRFSVCELVVVYGGMVISGRLMSEATLKTRKE